MSMGRESFATVLPPPHLVVVTDSFGLNGFFRREELSVAAISQAWHAMTWFSMEKDCAK